MEKGKSEKKSWGPFTELDGNTNGRKEGKNGSGGTYNINLYRVWEYV